MAEDNNNERVLLRVLGVTSNTLQSGVYAIILAQNDGPYRIPIVTGISEAQSVSIKLENFTSPRPLIHDLFCSFAHGFGIQIKEVFIYSYADGVFTSEIRFSDGERELTMDSRTSDAIAIALYSGAPIYTTKTILETVGTIFDEKPKAEENENSAPRKSKSASENQLTDEELQQRLDKFIEEENYEEAARISEILRKRNQE